MRVSHLCPGVDAHLFADVSSFLRSQLLQPISLDLVKVTLDSGLEGLVLPDGRRAKGAACELTWREHLTVMSSPARPTGEQHLTPTVKTSGLRRRLKACEEPGGAWSQWGVGAAALEDSLWRGPRSSSTFLGSGFFGAFLKPRCCWKLWGHLLDREET